jgi:hypothetical protein
MKFAVEMGSGAMIDAKFHKNWFMHLKVNEGGFTDTLTYREVG